jgi:beta-phosphoglucomutase
MKFKGVIFDFNGTLFWDTDYHNQAWDMFLSNRYRSFSDHEKNVYFHGKNNQVIFEFLLGRKASREEIENLVEEKESIYREICLKSGMHLASGAEDFFNFLQINHIPFTIATASGKNNLEFFIQQFHLNQWFDISRIVFDDGLIEGKPNPDIFLIAADRIGIPIHDCIIFEDSASGIQAALAAKAGKTILVSSGNSTMNFKGESISDFNQVNRGLF